MERSEGRTVSKSKAEGGDGAGAPVNAQAVLETLRAMGSERDRQGMARFGINTARALGVSMAAMSPLARQLRRRHGLAQELWETGVHEARILACLIADPGLATPELLEAWVRDLDSWDITDQFCNKLVVRTAWAWELAAAWAERPEEFVRRAGFSLMAQLAVHDKKAEDAAFLPLFGLVSRQADDGRNFVKKAVNWALRQIGKRNPALHREALSLARQLSERPEASARWIGRDAVKELEARG